MPSKSGIKVLFLPDQRDASPSHNGESLLDLALKSKVPMNHTCGGNATCGTCLVRVVKGLENLPPREGLELEMAEDRGFAFDERLSCQITVNFDLTVITRK